MAAADGFGDAIIEDVSDLAWSTFWKEHRVSTYVSIAVCIAFGAIIAGLQITMNAVGGFVFDPRVYMVAFSPLLIPLFFYYNIKSDIHRAFMLQIAKALNLEYKPSATPDISWGRTFDVSATGNQYLVDILSGSYREMMIRIYSHHYSTGHGKHKTPHQETIVEISYANPLPHVLMGFNSNIPSELEPVELEGNFSDEFSLFVTNGRQMEIRQIFQPDVMEVVMQNFKGHRIEIVTTSSGTKVYVSSEREIDNRKEFLAMFALTDHLMSRILPGLDSVARDSTSVA